jgi:tetratricopeptide (TPR) repeat protein
MGKRSRSAKKSARRNLSADLAHLETAQLVRSVSELEYLFKHTLTQETVYASLLKNTRREIHAHVARTYEELYADQLDEIAAPLAQHYAKAGDDAKTLTYSLRAGDAAARVYANIEAIMHYTRALEIAKRDGSKNVSTLQDLYLKRGRTFEHCGQFEQALANYAEMKSLAQERGNRAMELAALMARATLHATPTPLQNLALGRELLDGAITLARASNDRAAECKILWNMMLVEYFEGNHPSATVNGEQAIAIARELGLREQLAYVLNDISRNYIAIGRAQEARAVLEEARELWRALDNLPMLADNLGSSADAFLSFGQYAQALAFADEAYRLGKSIGNTWTQAYSRWMVGAIHLDYGEFAQGVSALEETISLGDQAGFVVAMWVARTMLALFCGQIGQAQKGIALLEPLIPQVEGRDIPFKAWGLATLGLLLWQTGETAKADELIEQAKQGANLQDLTTFVPVIVTIAESEPAIARGDYDRALTVATPLLDRFEQLGIRPYKTDVMLLAAKALRGKRDLAAAHELLTRARAEAESVNLRRTLWQILAELSGIERERGNELEARTLLAQSRAVIDEIVARTPDDPTRLSGINLRASFLNLPMVRQVINSR